MKKILILAMTLSLAIPIHVHAESWIEKNWKKATIAAAVVAAVLIAAGGGTAIYLNTRKPKGQGPIPPSPSSGYYGSSASSSPAPSYEPYTPTRQELSYVPEQAPRKVKTLEEFRAASSGVPSVSTYGRRGTEPAREQQTYQDTRKQATTSAPVLSEREKKKAEEQAHQEETRRKAAAQIARIQAQTSQAPQRNVVSSSSPQSTPSIQSNNPSVILATAARNKLNTVNKQSEDYALTGAAIMNLVSPELDSIGYLQQSILAARLAGHWTMANQLRNASKLPKPEQAPAMKTIWNTQRAEVIDFVEKAIPIILETVGSKMDAQRAQQVARTIEAL